MIKKIAFALLAGTCLACEDQLTITTQSQVISDQQKEIANLKKRVKRLEKEGILKDASIQRINQNVQAWTILQSRMNSSNDQ